MTYHFNKLYSKYFQKSRSFLAPILGLKKESKFPFTQSYLQWENVYGVDDHKLILTFEDYSKDKDWDKYLLNNIMYNPMLNEYHGVNQGNIIVSFDLHCIEKDYQHVLEGKYSKLSNLLKNKVRDFYGLQTPEWMYMESFLFPQKYIRLYSKLLNVDEEHIHVTGQLCDKPDLEKETLKLIHNAKHNDLNPWNMEQQTNIQTNTN
jgi:hypothetical protein